MTLLLLLVLMEKWGLYWCNVTTYRIIYEKKKKGLSLSTQQCHYALMRQTVCNQAGKYPPLCHLSLYYCRLYMRSDTFKDTSIS